MIARQALAIMLVLLLAFPLWGEPSVVGNVASSQAATVRGTTLTPGSTIYDGDTIEVGAHGNASIALTGGAQVQLEENSLARLMKTSDKVVVAVGRGRTSFRTDEKSPVEALVADATVRSVNGQPAVGIVYVRSSESVIIGAEKGSLLISTTHDAKTLTLREGEGVEVMMAPAKDRDRAGGAVPAGAWTAGKVVILAVILGGAVTAIGILLGRSEKQQSTKSKCDEISPFRCI